MIADNSSEMVSDFGGLENNVLSDGFCHENLSKVISSEVQRSYNSRWCLGMPHDGSQRGQHRADVIEFITIFGYPVGNV